MVTVMFVDLFMVLDQCLSGCNWENTNQKLNSWLYGKKHLVKNIQLTQVCLNIHVSYSQRALGTEPSLLRGLSNNIYQEHSSSPIGNHGKLGTGFLQYSHSKNSVPVQTFKSHSSVSCLGSRALWIRSNYKHSRGMAGTSSCTNRVKLNFKGFWQTLYANIASMRPVLKIYMCLQVHHLLLCTFQVDTMVVDQC